MLMTLLVIVTLIAHRTHHEKSTDPAIAIVNAHHRKEAGLHPGTLHIHQEEEDTMTGRGHFPPVAGREAPVRPGEMHRVCQTGHARPHEDPCGPDHPHRQDDSRVLHLVAGHLSHLGE